MIVKIQVRRGLSTQWTSVNPILSSGEFGYETDTGKLKIGNGSTEWVDLEYTLNPELINQIELQISGIELEMSGIELNAQYLKKPTTKGDKFTVVPNIDSDGDTVGITGLGYNTITDEYVVSYYSYAKASKLWFFQKRIPKSFNLFTKWDINTCPR